MKHSVFIQFLAVVFCSFSLKSDNGTYRYVPNSSFERGEIIDYKVHYGFVNAAVGQMVILDDLDYINQRPCYKIEVHGKSVGMFELFWGVDDIWATYLDTASIITHKFYRILKEGRYRKHEVIDFDHDQHRASVRTYDYSKSRWKDTRYYDVVKNVQDLVSGYYFMRTINFDTLSKGQTITIDAFFEDKMYDFDIKYLGTEQVKTKIGKINSHVISPVMPKNSLFDGKDSVKAWISADDRKIPLKIKASMFIGAIEVDITSYKKGEG